MANKFKAGDKVALKTGSPVMTVKGHAATHTSNGNVAIIDKYECIWNDGKKNQQAVFIEDVFKINSQRQVNAMLCKSWQA